MVETYTVIRVFADESERTVATGLTLDEAQAHCRDPETSSSTASAKTLSRVTGAVPWHDRYEQESRPVGFRTERREYRWRRGGHTVQLCDLKTGAEFDVLTIGGYEDHPVPYSALREAIDHYEEHGDWLDALPDRDDGEPRS